jgi:hypothetical protein
MKQLLLLVAISSLLLACNDNKTTDPQTDHENHSMNTAPAGGYADSINNGLIKEDTLKGSPARVAMSTIAGTHVHIAYSSPGVRNRVIWGGLVAYDEVWAAGAHHATQVRFYKDVLIDEKKIAAGTYALFMIPGNEKWTLILNLRYDQHMSDEYNEAEDIIRVTVKPEQHAITPRLTYKVEKTSDTSGSIIMTWEKISVGLPFKTI